MIINPIKSIIFDFGGVIIDLHFDRMKAEFQKLGLQDFDAYFTKLKQHAVFDLFDKGQASEAEFRRQVCQIVGIDVDDNEFDKAWNAILGEIPEHKLRFLESLDVPIFLLSNTNSIHKAVFDEYVKSRFGKQGIASYFSKAYFSHEMGMRKPDAEIFAKVIEENNLSASHTLFIDDTPQHVEGARRVGLIGYHLQDGEDISEVVPRFMR